MKHPLGRVLLCLYKGQTLYRIRTNLTLAESTLRGQVLDVGGGHKPDYFDYFTSGDYTLTMIDGSTMPIDFEKDALPYGDREFDTVILCNVLEHVFNFNHLLSEVRRVARGQLVGCVPFQFQYHPDPHDYFRYTKECLERILSENGFTNITITQLEGGLFMANFNNLTLSLPAILRPVGYLIYKTLDNLFLWLRPASVVRCPLGFVFTASV